jgi:hypothetical protein
VSNPRRSIVRARPSAGSAPAAQERRQQRLQANLARAEAALARWQKRLLRACAAVLKHSKQLARLQKQVRPNQP